MRFYKAKWRALPGLKLLPRRVLGRGLLRGAPAQYVNPKLIQKWCSMPPASRTVSAAAYRIALSIRTSTIPGDYQKIETVTVCFYEEGS